MPIFTKFHKSKHTKLDNVQQFYFLYVFFLNLAYTADSRQIHTYIFTKLKTAKNAGMSFIAALKFKLWSHVIDMIGAIGV